MSLGSSSNKPVQRMFSIILIENYTLTCSYTNEEGLEMVSSENVFWLMSTLWWNVCELSHASLSFFPFAQVEKKTVLLPTINLSLHVKDFIF